MKIFKNRILRIFHFWNIIIKGFKNMYKPRRDPHDLNLRLELFQDNEGLRENRQTLTRSQATQPKPKFHRS